MVLPRSALFFVVLLLLAPLAPAQSQSSQRSLDGLFQLQPLWGASREAFQPVARDARFQWVSSARETARASGSGLTFGGLPVIEALVRFGEGGLGGITFQFYNRGDAGTISEQEFEAKVRACQELFARGLGGPGTPREEAASVAVDSEALVWEVGGGEFVLEWSFQKEVKSRTQPFRAEFIRMQAAPIEEEPETFSLTTGIERATSGADPASHVRREANGDVLLAGVPMVDQGRKGYCVTASVERVLRYYGADIDQHEIAQLANSDADRGTSVKAMIEAMEDISNQTGVRVREHYTQDFYEFQDVVKEYNREAKRADLPEVVLPTRGVIDITSIYARMKGPQLKEARVGSRSDYGRFQRDIAELIDKGYPGVWSVMLGLVPEEPALPQAFGGHMRLIIGYNPESEEILYTDSWGRGHEMKRMSMADAWTITMGLSSLEPF